MLSFAYLSTRNLENLFHFNGMGNGMLIICEARKEVGSTRDTLIYFFLTFRVSCQFKETCASTMTVKRTSGPYSKFCESDSLTPLTEGAEGPRGALKDVQ